MKEHLLGLLDMSRHEDDPDRWSFLTEKDKCDLKLFALGLFFVALGVVELHARINPYWCF